MKKFEQLNIMDAFMFGKVMENPKIARRMLEKLLNKKIYRTFCHRKNIVTRADGRQGIYLEAYPTDQTYGVQNIRIYLCEKDIFGMGLGVYRFVNRCEEAPELFLEEDVLTIFLCVTEGEHAKEAEDIQAFLRYLSGSGGSRNNFIRMIEEEIRRIKKDSLCKKEYLEMVRGETERQQKAYAQAYAGMR